jgi:hypothetical protein
MAYLPGFEHDIFIALRAADVRASSMGRLG